MTAALGDGHVQRAPIDADQHLQQHRAGPAEALRVARILRRRGKRVLQLDRGGGRRRRTHVGRSGVDGARVHHRLAAGLADHRVAAGRQLAGAWRGGLRHRALRRHRLLLLHDLDRHDDLRRDVARDEARFARQIDRRRRHRQRHHQQAEGQQVEREGATHRGDPGGIEAGLFDGREQGEACRAGHCVDVGADHGQPPVRVERRGNTHHATDQTGDRGCRRARSDSTLRRTPACGNAIAMDGAAPPTDGRCPHRAGPQTTTPARGGRR